MSAFLLTREDLESALAEWHYACVSDDAIGSPLTRTRRQDCCREVRRLAREVAAKRDRRYFQRVEALRARKALMTAQALRDEMARNGGEP